MIACVGGAVHTFDKPTPLHFQLDGTAQFIDHYIEIEINQNITSLKEDISALINGTTRLRSLCRGSTDQVSCERTTGNIIDDTHLWTDRLTNAIQHRTRRVAPIIVVGAVALTVGAAAGATAATLSLKNSVAEFRDRVEELDARQEAVLKSIQEQTNIIEKSTSLVEKLNVKEINRHAHQEKLWNHTLRKLDEMVIRIEIQELLMFAQTIYDEINEITTFHGPHDRMLRRVNVSRILNYDQLFNESLHVHYRFQFIKASIQEDAILYKFLLPLTSPAIYKLYRVTIIPVINNENMIWLDLPINAIAVKDGNVRDINLEQCTQDSTKWICEPTTQEIHEVRTRCVAAVWKGQPTEGVCNTRTTPFRDTIIPLRDKSWAFALKEPVVIAGETLMGSGIYSTTSIALTNTLIFSETHKIYAPSISEEDPLDHVTEEDLTAPIEELKESIRHLRKQQQEIPSTRHYTTLGISSVSLLGTFAALIVFWCYTRSRKSEVANLYLNHFNLR